MIASLPMYDRPENAAAHDRLWENIRDALRDHGQRAPRALDRQIGLWEGWRHPQLVLGQTCGLPYRRDLHDKVELVCAIDYGLDVTQPGFYHSLFVAREDDQRDALADFASARFVYNDASSHSGWSAPYFMAAKNGFSFKESRATGAHRESLREIADGTADISAVDAITWRAVARHDAFARKLRIVGRTDPAPGLPWITAKGNDTSVLFSAITQGIDALSADDIADLGVCGICEMTKDQYLAEPSPPAP